MWVLAPVRVSVPTPSLVNAHPETTPLVEESNPLVSNAPPPSLMMKLRRDDAAALRQQRCRPRMIRSPGAQAIVAPSAMTIAWLAANPPVNVLGDAKTVVPPPEMTIGSSLDRPAREGVRAAGVADGDRAGRHARRGDVDWADARVAEGDEIRILVGRGTTAAVDPVGVCRVPVAGDAGSGLERIATPAEGHHRRSDAEGHWWDFCPWWFHLQTRAPLRFAAPRGELNETDPLPPVQTQSPRR